MNSTIRISSAADVAAATPYLVGHHPDRELVTLGYSDSTFIVGGTVALDDTRRLGYGLAIGSSLRNRGIRRVLLVGYGPDEVVTPVMYEAKTACTDLGILIGEALRITDGRWWSYLEPDETGENGTAVDNTRPVVAALVAAGRAPLASPEAVAAQLAADPDSAERIGHAAAGIEQAVWKRRRDGGDTELITEAGELVENLTITGHVPDDYDAALMGVLLTTPQLRITVRNTAMAAIDGEPSDTVVAWCGLTRILPEAYRWQAANLAAYAAWRSGDGVLARDAVNLSLSIVNGADNSLGRLMRRALETGTAPHEVAGFTAADFSDPDVASDL